MNASLYQPEGNDVSDLLNSFIFWISCAVIEEFGKGEHFFHILCNVYNLYYFLIPQYNYTAYHILHAVRTSMQITDC